ncbi:hypothetical protein Mnod_8177 (plasmid) [Methylobacterium nodulans ORS 2060]|uniref:Uncharacterized protein n=1 Tax=Methylobacterium nodulans (strain LMG 21967 / CNCM I-2342 / ORS 2060) TaxID=460265 RepID=B8IXB2_METNO|nr:hypothetical protein Mnod_8177 [Methylobacterium nodulans ORS 2060]
MALWSRNGAPETVKRLAEFNDRLADHCGRALLLVGTAADHSARVRNNPENLLTAGSPVTAATPLGD